MKVPAIEFTFASTAILDPVNLDPTAKVSDGDGDWASSSFPELIETDEGPLDDNDLSYTERKTVRVWLTIRPLCSVSNSPAGIAPGR